MAEFCGRCHSNAAFMQKHNPKQRVDQVKLYAAERPRGQAGRRRRRSRPPAWTATAVHNTRAVERPAVDGGSREAGPHVRQVPRRFVRPVPEERARGRCSSRARWRPARRATASHADDARDRRHAGRRARRVLEVPRAGLEGRKVAAAMGRTFENTRMGRSVLRLRSGRGSSSRASAAGAPLRQDRGRRALRVAALRQDLERRPRRAAPPGREAAGLEPRIRG